MHGGTSIRYLKADMVCRHKGLGLSPGSCGLLGSCPAPGAGRRACSEAAAASHAQQQLGGPEVQGPVCAARHAAGKAAEPMCGRLGLLLMQLDSLPAPQHDGVFMAKGNLEAMCSGCSMCRAVSPQPSSQS